MGLDGCILPRSQSVRLLSYPCSQEVSRRLICHPPRRFRRPNWIATCLGAAFNTCWGVQKLNTASIGAYTQLKPDSTSTPCSQGAGGGGPQKVLSSMHFWKDLQSQSFRKPNLHHSPPTSLSSPTWHTPSSPTQSPQRAPAERATPHALPLCRKEWLQNSRFEADPCSVSPKELQPKSPTTSCRPINQKATT